MNGYLSNDSIVPLMIGVVFLISFGIVSLGTWAYFRYRPARVGLDRRGEEADPELSAEDADRAAAHTELPPDMEVTAAVDHEAPTQGASVVDTPITDMPTPEGGSPA